jgi:hypothetical protein
MVQNNSLSKKSKSGGVLNIFRHIQTQVLSFLRRGNKPIFLKDDLVGDFSGNILESIAKLFPPAVASKIEMAPPIPATWKVFERITWEGARGFRYFVSPGTSIQVLEVVSSIYQEKHRLKSYPGMFNGTEDHLPSFCLNVDYNLYNEKQEIAISEEYFVIWLPDKIQLNVSSA